MDMEQYTPKPPQKSQIHHKNAAMAFYNKKEQLYLEIDALGIALEAGLLQMRDDMQFLRNEAPDNAELQLIAFTSKSFISAETHNSNIERDALVILHGLEMFHHYYFTHRDSVITDLNLLVEISRDVASLSQRLQRILI